MCLTVNFDSERPPSACSDISYTVQAVLRRQYIAVSMMQGKKGSVRDYVLNINSQVLASVRSQQGAEAFKDENLLYIFQSV